jgi:RNA polymerase sigma-70 factor (ECF subfamily)
MSETICLEPSQIHVTDEDINLVRAAQQNPADFKQLYLKWLKPVYRYFFFRIGNEKDAEDLTSQVFLKIFQDLPRYRNQGTFSAWLFTIAHARTVDFYRKGNREVPLENASRAISSSNPLSQTIQTEAFGQINHLIRNLSEDEQELIRLRYAANLNYREIGQILNRKEDSVRKTLSRLLDRIHAELEKVNE